MKRKILISIPIVLIGLGSAIGWIFSGLVLYPKVQCSKEHHVFCETPAELGMPFEPFSATSSDGLPLPGWYIPAAGSRKVIIMVHGHGGMRNEGLRYAPVLHKAGFNLVLFDMRRNAKGGFASMGFYERKDLVNVIDVAKENWKNESVGLFGFSMGAATSIMTMAEDKRVAAGLFSSGYASASDVLVEAAARDYHLPRFPIFPIVKFFIDMRGHMDLAEATPENYIGKISPRPIMLFHCDADDYVASNHMDRLFRAAGEPKAQWLATCNKHERLWNTNQKEAEDRAVQFFRENLK